MRCHDLFGSGRFSIRPNGIWFDDHMEAGMAAFYEVKP